MSYRLTTPQYKQHLYSINLLQQVVLCEIYVCNLTILTPGGLAASQGFEPWVDFRPSLVFKTSSLNRSDNLPYYVPFWAGNGTPQLLDGWSFLHLSFTTNNHRQYPPLYRFVFSFRFLLHQPVETTKP